SSTQFYMSSRTYTLAARSLETCHREMQGAERLCISSATGQLPKSRDRWQRGLGSLVLRLSCEKREPAAEFECWAVCDRDLDGFTEVADCTFDVPGVEQRHAAQLKQTDVRRVHFRGRRPRDEGLNLRQPGRPEKTFRVRHRRVYYRRRLFG